MSIDLSIKPETLDEFEQRPEEPSLVILQASGISYKSPCYIPCDQVVWRPQAGDPHAVIYLNKTATDNGTYIEQIAHGNTIDFEGIAVRVMIWDLCPGERIAVKLRRAVDP